MEIGFASKLHYCTKGFLKKSAFWSKTHQINALTKRPSDFHMRLHKGERCPPRLSWKSFPSSFWWDKNVWFPPEVVEHNWLQLSLMQSNKARANYSKEGLQTDLAIKQQRARGIQACSLKYWSKILLSAFVSCFCWTPNVIMQRMSTHGN